MRALILAGVLMAAVPSSLLAVANQYVEDFSSTTFQDGTNTTADWDTIAGELKLNPFAASAIGSFDTPGEAVGVAVSGDYAFVADALSGLQILDITDPSNPSFVGTYNTPGESQDVAVAGHFAFVADNTSGLQILDVSDPTTPLLLATYDTPDKALGVVVTGDLVFVADHLSGLQIIDISDPSAPTLAGTYDTAGDGWDVDVWGHLAFVADGSLGLLVLDVSDPSTPTLVGTYDTPDFARSLVVSGTIVYVADGNPGLLAIDVTDPTTPSLVGAYDPPLATRGVTVWGDIALVTDFSDVHVVDITDPTSPTLLQSVTTPGLPAGVTVAGNRAYVADGESGLDIVEFSAPTNLRQVAAQAAIDFVQDVAVAGNVAYVADGNAGLQILDISDPTMPMPIGSYDTAGYAIGVELSGDVAVVTDGFGGVALIDVSDPGNPSLAGTVAVSGLAAHLALHGKVAFVTGGEFELHVIDFSDPTSPSVLIDWMAPDGCSGVATSGDHAYVAAGETGLLILDISDPSAPVLIGTADTPDFAENVAISGNLAFVPDDFALQVIDVSDPTSPSIVGSVETPGYATGVEVSGDRAIVRDYFGLVVVDISDPANPLIVSSYGPPGFSVAIAGGSVEGERAFIPVTDDGLYVFELYQHEVDETQNVAQSLSVNGAPATIPRVRLASTETTGVSWEVSVDGGTGWTGIPADDTWQRIPTPGPDLRWRSTHEWEGVNPTVTDLTLEWLHEPGPIVSVSDVPNDQGGWAQIDIRRSGYDFADEDSIPVTGYQIYRRVDVAARARSIAALPSAPETVVRADPALASFGSSRVRILGDERFVLGGTRSGSPGELPPGVWQVVAWVVAIQQDAYNVAVPTPGDSTAMGITWSVNLVTTHTTTPSIWFASVPDSGYSVDNIPPMAPIALHFESSDVLAWDSAPETDFGYHTAYGSSEPTLDASATLIGHTVEPSFDISSAAYVYYHVTTTDYAGNEGAAASIANPFVAAPDPVTLPRVFAVHAPRPNPFRSGTWVPFSLPRTGVVRVAIFDAVGREVRVIEGSLPPGERRLYWDGTDLSGRTVAAGVYFARIAAVGVTASRRIVRIE